MSTQPRMEEARLMETLASLDKEKQKEVLVDLAAEGNAAAATELLRKLSQENFREQLAYRNLIISTNKVAFWEGLLEFVVAGTWRGQPLEVVPSVSGCPRTLKPLLQSLFLAKRDGGADSARDEALLNSLRSSNPDIRRVAAGTLGERKSRRAIDELARHLTDPHPRVRLHAARALKRIADPTAVEPLIRCLSHEDEILSGEAADALGAIGPAAVPPLLQVLQSRDGWLRWLATRALSHIGDERAIDSLITALKDEDGGVRWLAAEALIKSGPKAVEPLLRALLREKMTPWFQEGSHHVIGSISQKVNGRRAAILRPLLLSLEEIDAGVEAPVAAARALDELRSLGLLAA